MSFRLAVFPGSFDPITNGHTDVIDRALALVDRLVVAVVTNTSKKVLFSADERVSLIQESCAKWGDRVEVTHFDGLLVHLVKSLGARVVIRGLRAVSDYEYEAQMALINRRLDPTIETFFLMSKESCAYVSSSIVKQVASFGGDVSALVPPMVATALSARFAPKGTVSLEGTC